MASLISKASLLMVPSVYEDGTLYNVLPSGNKAPDETGNHNGYDQTRADFTFSRGSNLAATRVNSDGLIEKGRENLLLQSNSFNTSPFVKSNVSLSSGQEGYDGSSNAWELSTTGVNGFENLYQNLSFTGVNTISIYAKKGTNDYLTMRSLTSDFRVQFKLDDGTHSTTYGSPIDTFMVDVGNGWYRCGFTANFSGATSLVLYPQPIGTTDAGNIYIQSAQLEKSLVPTDYIETGSSTAQAGILEDMPRINYDANGENGALLLEPSRSNLVPFGNYFDGTGWSKNGSITTTTNTSGTKSPEGVYNATLLTSANATSEQQMLISSLSTTSGTSYAFSVFAKKKDYDFIHLRFQGSGSAFAAGSVYFNISSGSVGHEDSGKTGYIEDYGNGWYRCTAVATATATSSGAACRVQLASSDNASSVVGDGVKGTYVFGCQFEAGSYPSSLIPTHGAAVTRGADSCSVTGVSDVIGQTEGTLFVEFITPETNSYFIHSVSDGTNNNKVQIEYNTTSDTLIGIVRVSGVTEVSISATGMTPNTRYKAAIAYKANDFVFYVNGTQKGTDTSGSVPSSMSAIHLGSQVGTFFESGEVYNATLFDTRLSNSELATLTTL